VGPEPTAGSRHSGHRPRFLADPAGHHPGRIAAGPSRPGGSGPARGDLRFTPPPKGSEFQASVMVVGSTSPRHDQPPTLAVDDLRLESSGSHRSDRGTRSSRETVAPGERRRQRTKLPQRLSKCVLAARRSRRQQLHRDEPAGSDPFTDPGDPRVYTRAARRPIPGLPGSTLIGTGTTSHGSHRTDRAWSRDGTPAPGLSRATSKIHL
jgi:hypothetical protein